MMKSVHTVSCDIMEHKRCSTSCLLVSVSETTISSNARLAVNASENDAFLLRCLFSKIAVARMGLWPCPYAVKNTRWSGLLPNLWAFSPVSRIEIGSGIILETSFNNNSVFLSFSIINSVLLLLYLYFMFRFFFKGYCIFSGQPFPAVLDLILISGCARSKLSAVVEIKSLHIICRNVLCVLIHHFLQPRRAFSIDLSLC